MIWPANAIDDSTFGLLRQGTKTATNRRDAQGRRATGRCRQRHATGFGRVANLGRAPRRREVFWGGLGELLELIHAERQKRLLSRVTNGPNKEIAAPQLQTGDWGDSLAAPEKQTGLSQTSFARLRELPAAVDKYTPTAGFQVRTLKPLKPWRNPRWATGRRYARCAGLPSSIIVQVWRDLSPALDSALGIRRSST